jgi:hypothetical protein
MYQEHIQPLENTGLSDSEIAALIDASTASDIPVADLENFLDFEGLAKRNPITGAWEGPLADEIVNNVHGLGPALGDLFSHINKPRSTVVDTTVSPWGLNAKALTDGLVAAGLLTADQQAAFYALGGGRPNEGTTEQDVVDARAAYDAEVAAEAAEEAARVAEQIAVANHNAWSVDFIGRYNLNIAPVLDDSPSRDNAALVAALRTLADDLETNPWSV